MNTEIEKVKILSAGAITAKLKRMAFEIYERNFKEEELIFVSIGPRGEFLAKQLAVHMVEISNLNISQLRLIKSESADDLNWQLPDAVSKIEGKTVIIVDDVLYSGKTMFTAVAEVVKGKPNGVQVAVLIDRGHRTLPVSHDFVGMEMATSLKQYISMEVDSKTSRAAAYIF